VNGVAYWAGHGHGHKAEFMASVIFGICFGCGNYECCYESDVVLAYNGEQTELPFASLRSRNWVCQGFSNAEIQQPEKRLSQG